MAIKKKIKIALCLSSFVFLLIVVIFFIKWERKFCMGVPVISEEKLLEYVETTEMDISSLMFEGKKIAIDWPGNQVYISQSEEKLKKYYSLQGKLETSNPEYEVLVLDTEELRNLSTSVKEGIPITLILKSGANYQKVNTVITTLPILLLDLHGTGEDEQGRNNMYGTLTLWNNVATASDTYQTATSQVQWRMRGNSTRIYPKLSWKVNLRDSNWANLNVELLGLGSDDDWILNPMSMDDTFVKEKITQELWKQLCEQTDYNYHMSQGKYVELFINGGHQGLYLLQRRVDTKYLGLNKEKDILLKGINIWEAEKSEDAYEIVSTPYDVEETYKMLEKVIALDEKNFINTDNFIDVSLLLQFLSAVDNYGYKNMFYVLKDNVESRELFFVPWDTDLSLGVTWGHDYESSMNEIIERYEMSVMRQEIPDIDKRIADRWFELRKTVYSEENILSIYADVTEKLINSGAIKRDVDKWGMLHEGEDNWQSLQIFIKERLSLLDNYYTQF